MSSDRIILQPIGYVRTKAVGDQVKDKTHLSEIVLDWKLTKALDGIREFSHVFVLFWLHEISNEKRKMLKIHPRGRQDMPLLGVFAARTNLRPNPIGLTLCELVKVDDNVLTVRGLDAYDKTPVLDIKPYDSWDCAPNARMPEWWKKLEAEKEESNQALH
ncbi:MAG TPA: tRNA (N6-threonylcarbamoyladenosine(37)-N6)-methyltransferase TrmO [Candidatus Sulfotelmatobacter sp.]|nr:tRNA (N6-threonylcarbamoyladenosine(37)-N6)-methyltransferase TrmO [Candidatus Sulfotelmatobacter sp.]